MPIQRPIAALIALWLSTAPLCWGGPEASLPPEDDAAVRAVVEAYCEGWLDDDAEAVLATLTADAVLHPSGLRPIVGEEAIRSFWWPPDGPVTKVVAMELVVDETGGEGTFAFARGRGSLTFSYEQDGATKTVSAKSTFLNILRKGADGSWKISHRAWSDLPND